MFNDFGAHRHRRGPMFEKGALKYLMLDLVGNKSRHGYDIIRELEESSGGCYSPSPGTIYPTLQMLEDVGHVVVKKENGKKIYEITDEGREYLKAHEDVVKQHRERMDECFAPMGSPEFASMMREMKSLFHLVMQTAGRGGVDPEKAIEIKEILAKAEGQIESVIRKSPK